MIINLPCCTIQSFPLNEKENDKVTRISITYIKDAGSMFIYT